MKLVLIDDNFAIRFLLKSFLAEYFPDFDIFSAEDGISGLGLIYAVNPDAVIIDSTLPKYSGREVVEYVVTN